MSEKYHYFFGLDKKRYLTRGIADRMPDEYIMLMWQWIDMLVLERGKDVDYLQIFEFDIVTERDKTYQQITHFQEQPEIKSVYRLELAGEGIIGKVYAIDDSEQCTLLWSSEY